MKKMAVSVLLALNGILFLTYSISIGYWESFLDVPYPKSQVFNSVFPFVSLFSFVLGLYVVVYWKDSKKDGLPPL